MNTLSSTPVASWLTSPLATARPTYIVGRLIVIAPIVSHVRPSSDCDAVTWLPRRSRRIQYGLATAVPGLVTCTAPADTRWWKLLPDDALMNIRPITEFAASLSRIITPALLHVDHSSMDTTRARMSMSPVTSRYAKWNLSAVPPTSPAPASV